MRRLITILIAAAMTMTLLILKANAQGNGKAKGHHKHEWKNDRGHSRYDRQDNVNVHEHYYGGHYEYHEPHPHVHSRHRDHHVIVRRIATPRYVYYRDHNIYFDNHRNVYITLSGRRWIVTAEEPVHLRRINFSREVCHTVEYYDDDFVSYLEHRTPAYGAVYYARR